MSAVQPPSRRVGPRSIQSFSSSTADKSTAPNRPPTAKPVTLAKRILFPTLPADADLPALLLSPEAEPELNAELYGFIALALRAFVNTWWSKITRYDKEFLPEIARILTVVVRAFEARLLATDLSPLVFRDLPTLLSQHWIDYRNAQAKLHTSYASGGAASIAQLFHQSQPHMAVSAEGVIDPVYVRQAVDHILKTCLPPEDYEPETERYIVREIILKVLVGSVLPRVTQPWFIHKIILDQLGPEKAAGKVPEVSDPTTRPPLARQSSAHFSFQSIAIVVLSAVQAVSGVCLAILHAYKQARDTIKKVNERNDPGETGFFATPSIPGTLNPSPRPPPPQPTHLPSPTSESGSFLQAPSRTSSTSSHSPTPPSSSSPTCAPAPILNYTHPPLTFLLLILNPPPASANSPSPYTTYTTARALTHLLSLFASLAAPFLGRLLPYILYTHVLSPGRLSNIIRSAKTAIFPDGWPGPPPIDPTPEEQAETRAAVRRRLADRIPSAVGPLLGPTPEARLATIDAALAPLDDAACNAHMAMFIVDLVLLTVFPEMGVSEDV
ncbi:PXA domain-containing protein [Epithele typhae]|uniref:PXA domain-containing protein n=1 Tax=Epithele typhae TaxID=378194 RepID=UPI002007BE72|nr:PXA domain-containing protein [Epithele typhae]XP_047882921.1 PXA domain-containing protein [Epithele typhae]KAH9921928.1 PXA domain-containing protein [Epithele typhae]KAH9944564.1 PXA domain-containing protein [Epithele typhae]